MNYILISTTNFSRGLKRLSKDDESRARKTLGEIVTDPYSFKQLRGRYQELRSARFGNYRIVYAIKEQEKEVILLAIELRGTIYQR